MFFPSLFRFIRHLGAGQFGSVDEGLWRKGSQDVPVAMKALKAGASERDKVKFLQEAVTMAQFKHPNVVTMYGMVAEGEPVRSRNKIEGEGLLYCLNRYS